MLTARTRAEVVARNEDASSGIPRIVEDERRRLLGAVFVEAPIVEEGVGEPRLHDHLQVARWDDLVGVHVLRGQRDQRAAEALDFRRAHQASVRGSVMRPRNAVAAAVSGEAKKVRPPFP